MVFTFVQAYANFIKVKWWYMYLFLFMDTFQVNEVYAHYLDWQIINHNYNQLFKFNKEIKNQINKLIIKRKDPKLYSIKKIIYANYVYIFINII